MRPLTPQPANPTSPISLQDAVTPDRWYAYRAVAVSASGLRSDPTAPVWVRAETDQPPMAPEITAVSQPTTGSRDREIDVQLTGYALSIRLERQLFGTGRWTTVRTWTLDDLTTEPSPRTATLTDEVPADKADAVFEYRVMVVDRRGASTTSDVEVRQ